MAGWIRIDDGLAPRSPIHFKNPACRSSGADKTIRRRRMVAGISIMLAEIWLKLVQTCRFVKIFVDSDSARRKTHLQEMKTP